MVERFQMCGEMENEQLRYVSPNKIISREEAERISRQMLRRSHVEQDKRSGPKDQINNPALSFVYLFQILT